MLQQSKNHYVLVMVHLVLLPLHKDNVVNTTVYMRPKIGMNTDEKYHLKWDIYTFENLNFRGETISK